jgi:hypothetical protein
VKKFSFYFTNTKYNHKIPQIRSYLWNMGQSRHKNNNPVVKRQINIKKQSSDNLLPKPRVRPGILLESASSVPYRMYMHFMLKTEMQGCH